MLAVLALCAVAQDEFQFNYSFTPDGWKLGHEVSTNRDYKQAVLVAAEGDVDQALFAIVAARQVVSEMDWNELSDRVAQCSEQFSFLPQNKEWYD